MNMMLVGIPDTKKKITSTSLEREMYSKISSNNVLTAMPSVLHFSGFTLNVPHRIKVRIVNVSVDSTRMHIFYPRSDVFSGKCAKKGTIYAGMAEEIEIVFTPTSYQYYYDVLKIQHESGNLMIPIHAYPVINEIKFPRYYDFGTHALGERVARNIVLKCSVPINFEFRIEVLKAHDDFSISPLNGIIPANGKIPIRIIFIPRKMACVSAEIKLNISQFGFTPLLCSILGSSSPDATRIQRKKSTSNNDIEEYFDSNTILDIEKDEDEETTREKDQSSRKVVLKRRPKKKKVSMEEEKNQEEEAMSTNTGGTGGDDVVHSVPSYRVSTEAGVTFVYQDKDVVDLNPYTNTIWGKRKRAVRRFVQGVSRCIIRLRADKRITQLKALLINCTTRAHVQKLVHDDWQAAQVPSKSRNELHPIAAEDIPMHTIRLEGFPLILEQDTNLRTEQQCESVREFNDFQPFRLKIPQEADLIGYTPLTVPPVSVYFPLEADRELLTGALYEYGRRRVRNMIPPDHLRMKDADTVDPITDMLSDMQYTTFDAHTAASLAVLTTPHPILPLQLLQPDASLRLYSQMNPIGETSSELALQPSYWTRSSCPTKGETLRHSIGGLSAVWSMEETAALSRVWQATLQAPFSTVGEKGEPRGTWDMPSTVPAFLETDTGVESLSESESDNEVEGQVQIPTMEEAKDLFGIMGDWDSRPFSRSAAFIAMETAYNAQRQTTTERLDSRMRKAADRVQKVRHQLVLQGHGEPFPQHFP